MEVSPTFREIKLIPLSVFLDAKILPGPEEHLALYVTHRQELAFQALPLPGWSPQRAPENLPPLEGLSQIACHFMISTVKVTIVCTW